MPTIPEALQMAIAAHQAGRLPQAETIYRQILAVSPDHADSLHLLGLIAHQTGRSEAALELIRRAIAINPTFEAYHNNLGGVLVDMERYDEAIVAFERALAIRPDYPEVHYNLSKALRLSGHFETAAEHCRTALRSRPDYAEAHNNLGAALQEQGRLGEAKAEFTEALRLNPNLPDGHFNMGNVLRLQGRFSQALPYAERALAMQPNSASAYSNLGAVLEGLNRIDEAIACFEQGLAKDARSVEILANLATAYQARGNIDQALESCQRALAIKPGFIPALVNLGGALQEQGHIDLAVEQYRAALAKNPNAADAHASLSDALRNLGRLDESRMHCERAIELRAEHPEGQFNLGLLDLITGNFASGWEAYEARWRQTGALHKPDLAEPEWDGSPAPGKTLLIYAEQGLGDTLQFVRYARLVRQRVGRLVFQSPRALYRLLSTVEGIDQLLTAGSPFPSFDVQLPLLSVARVLQTRLDTIPAEVPYLSAPAAEIERWAEKLDGLSSGEFRVGIAWAGNPRHRRDAFRSIPPQFFARLSESPGVRFFSLQKETHASPWPREARPLVDLTTELSDFVDTAALVKNLDLVICCDTSVAHLAGALAVPVWVAMPATLDWRWLVDREDSPWYPTMRLFRQTELGKWDDVFERVGHALAGLARP